jgi:formylmethanofuran dehydrogenase subunit A
MTYLKISGGTVYDPSNGIDGLVRDLWIRDGRIVAAPADPAVRADRVIDAAGLVVMPGGIDMHCHIAGPKVNTARKMRPEEKRSGELLRRTDNLRSGAMGSVPTTFATGYKYAGMGYTTAFDAAVPPLGARHAHEEFADTPCVDKGFYVLMGNNHYVMQCLRDREPAKMQAFVAWLLGATKAYAIKIVNPGGVENWKHRPPGNVATIDSTVDYYHVTPRQILRELAQTADELKLPHAVHIHGNNLGLPGNWQTTRDTMAALEGRRGHLTHIQFHSYGGGEGDENTFNSKVAPLADYVNRHPNLTVDVGQVMFGPTTSMTGDGPVGYFLHNLYGTKWFSGDTELESGCGVAPIEYRNKSLVHALQWAIGLEWYLLVEDPWRVAMSTDHPNGGSFLAYPQIIRLLMDRAYRQEALSALPAQVRERCVLADLTREYSLAEICIITRSGPARILGLRNKGHLGPGADADVTVYLPNDDREQMFSLPKFVLKAGRVILDNGELGEPNFGKTLHVAPSYDGAIERELAQWFDDHYSIRFANYPVTDDYLHDAEQIATI